ncbi:MAG: hypothetical protein KDD45_14875 [Bdellovibrionales bacterium]|nr:hypothetical protein [Bdellovibrionales bacterium]
MIKHIIFKNYSKKQLPSIGLKDYLEVESRIIAESMQQEIPPYPQSWLKWIEIDNYYNSPCIKIITNSTPPSAAICKAL